MCISKLMEPPERKRRDFQILVGKEMIEGCFVCTRECTFHNLLGCGGDYN